MVEAETPRSVSGRRSAATRRAAASGLVVAAVVCVWAAGSSGNRGWGSVELDREPAEVRQLEREASKVRCKRGLRAHLSLLSIYPLPGWPFQSTRGKLRKKRAILSLCEQ